jgi:hypothetical protein
MPQISLMSSSYSGREAISIACLDLLDAASIAARCTSAPPPNTVLELTPQAAPRSDAI